MVLAELGEQITQALKRLPASTAIYEKEFEECLKEIVTALLKADIQVKLVGLIRNNVRSSLKALDKNSHSRRTIQKLVFDELVKLLQSAEKPFHPVKGKCNVVMMVGLQGSGKTTTSGKYALYYKRKGFRVSLICADTFRAGAFDQIKQNATRIGVPFYGSQFEKNPVKVAIDGVKVFKKEKLDLIIVDTSGRHMQDTSLFVEMKEIEQNVKPDHVIFVMDSHLGQACYDQAIAFKKTVNVGSVIVTKLDGHAKGGGALSAVAATKSPIIFYGSGEQFEDFQTFDAKSFISRLLGMGDVKGLINTIADAIPLEKQPEMMERLVKGKFSLRDMRDQFEGLLKMGSFSNVIGMIPGMSANILPKSHEKKSIDQIKRFLVMMNSMNSRELDGEKELSIRRIFRIARGSGHSVDEVKFLIERYLEFSKMIGKLGKKRGKRGGMDISNMMRNPTQALRDMQKVIDPRVMNQIGGAENLMSMMKQINKIENLPSMQQFLKKRGGIR